ncbi:MAG: hypothetical protein Q4B68_08340 [Bacteroidales bacterium]|nr:hypothetical protein [Bacteroidales bacterium]
MAANVERCVMDGIPPLVMMMLAYGQDEVERNLRLIISHTFLRIEGAKMSTAQVETIAHCICQSPAVRTLNYDLVCNFFTRVIDGTYNVYSATPYRVMMAFQEYAKAAFRTQERLRMEHETRLRRQQDAILKQNTITYEEFCRRTGRDPHAPLFTNFTN